MKPLIKPLIKKNIDLLFGGQGGGTAPSPVIVLSASSIAEDAISGTVVGILSVLNGSGSYTFTITADPDSKFDIDTADLITDAALDYEIATSHSVTIEADNGVDAPISRVFSITVTDVPEGGGNDVRITEDNDRRITESGDVRILEAA